MAKDIIVECEILCRTICFTLVSHILKYHNNQWVTILMSLSGSKFISEAQRAPQLSILEFLRFLMQVLSREYKHHFQQR